MTRRVPFAWFARNIVVGALLGGGYGAIHDQVSWSISPEYFTKFKFEQFAWADLGLEPRLAASWIGFLATWWAGAIAAYVVSRMAFRHAYGQGASGWPLARVVHRLLVVLAIAMAGGVCGFAFARIRAPDVDRLWGGWRTYGGVQNLEAFATVGSIHNFGYAGALLGIVLVALHIKRQGRVDRSSPEGLPPPVR
ncbi:MAG: hypothetical protein H6832_18765 [Planctomycetes bacterium]|nr:hypothetical protein [Planctomycetota bacterium]MCB9920452.1 hypothetical protein [Planctomycetota bacterium]